MLLLAVYGVGDVCYDGDCGGEVVVVYVVVVSLIVLIVIDSLWVTTTAAECVMRDLL